MLAINHYLAYMFKDKNAATWTTGTLTDVTTDQVVALILGFPIS